MKIDFKRTVASYKAKRDRFSIIDVPAMQYLMIDGHNGPGHETFSAAIETLYPVAYTLKFMSKTTLAKDYVVPPLEALWWADDMRVFTTNFDQSQWDWTAMIMQPSWITGAQFEEAVGTVAAKKKGPSLERLRLSSFDEGRCVQTLHIGPFSDEGPVIAAMHDEFLPENKLTLRGKHHEIYFNDFRKAAPEKLRTLLRQPVADMPP